MVPNVALDPVGIARLVAVGEMLGSRQLTHLLQQLHGEPPGSLGCVCPAKSALRNRRARLCSKYSQALYNSHSVHMYQSQRQQDSGVKLLRLLMPGRIQPAVCESMVRWLGSTMERGFDIKTGSLAIGDPTMGLVTFDLQLPSGRYRCEPGAIRPRTARDTKTITLDGPYLFVVDASLADKFLEWYNREFNECGF